jgi:hypothetical protein
MFSQAPASSATPQIAITENGRKVTLKSDGTWEYQAEVKKDANDINPKAGSNDLSAFTEYDRFTDTSTVNRSRFNKIGQSNTV